MGKVLVPERPAHFSHLGHPNALWVHERWDCKREGAVEVATVHHHTSAVSPSTNQDSPLLPHKDSFTIRVIPVTLQKLHN